MAQLKFVSEYDDVALKAAITRISEDRARGLTPELSNDEAHALLGQYFKRS